MRKALKDYDQGAVKGRKDRATGEVKYWTCFEDRYVHDAEFKANMQKCNPPRDLSFRAYVEALPVVRKSDEEWKEDLRKRKGTEKGGDAKGKGKASGNTTPDSKGKGKGKEKEQREPPAGRRKEAAVIERSPAIAGTRAQDQEDPHLQARGPQQHGQPTNGGPLAAAL